MARLIGSCCAGSPMPVPRRSARRQSAPQPQSNTSGTGLRGTRRQLSVARGRGVRRLTGMCVARGRRGSEAARFRSRASSGTSMARSVGGGCADLHGGPLVPTDARRPGAIHCPRRPHPEAAHLVDQSRRPKLASGLEHVSIGSRAPAAGDAPLQSPFDCRYAAQSTATTRERGRCYLKAGSAWCGCAAPARARRRGGPSRPPASSPATAARRSAPTTSRLAGARAPRRAPRALRAGRERDLAATAVWGTQQAQPPPGPKYDGVFGICREGPGRRSLLRQRSSTATTRHGDARGVLALCGDDRARSRRRSRTSPSTR